MLIRYIYFVIFLLINDSLGNDLGYESLIRRSINLPQAMRSCDAMPVPVINLDLNDINQIAITGIGTSASHAKYLVTLLRDHLSIPAYFKHVGTFCHKAERNHKNEALIVISQGLSPNIRIALQQQEKWSKVILITAATLEGALLRNEQKKYDVLKRLQENDGQIIQFTGENEYETLIRLTGPLTGLLMMNKVAQGFANLSAVRPKFFDINIETILTKIESAKIKAKNAIEHLHDSWIYDANYLIVDNGSSDLVDNLRFKLMEGLFIPLPDVYDLLDFSHGPMQQSYEIRANFFRLKTPDSNEKFFSLFNKTLNKEKHQVIDVAAELPSPYSLFEYEAFFNELVLDALFKHKIDQINWPGKGLDTFLYSFDDSLGFTD